VLFGRNVLIAILGVLSAGGLAIAVAAQEKGGTDETGPYDRVDNWFKPIHEGRRQCVLGVFAETADRIYLATEVEVAASMPSGPCTPERNKPDAHSHFLLVVDRNGKMIEEWTQWAQLFGLPHAIKINPYDPEKHVWVVNRDAHQVYQFTHDGKQLVMTLGEKGVTGNDEKHFNLPADIAFLPDSSFLVADGYGNSRLAKFDRKGKFLGTWGTNGSGPGQFKVPHGVAIDARRRVYVADRDNMRIQVFDENGKHVDEWPDVRGVVSAMATGDQAMWVLTGTTNRLLKYDLTGKLLTYWGTSNRSRSSPWAVLGGWHAPHSFSVDPEGNLYVADYRNHDVKKYVPKLNTDRQRLVGQPLRN
jgi:peptidylamidoglycolate lyase